MEVGQSLLLLAVGYGMEDKTPPKESRWGAGLREQSRLHQPASRMRLSGNSRPVGIWDTSLVVFCREKKKSHLLFGSVAKSRFFFSP